MPNPFDPVPTPDSLPYWEAAKEGRLSIQLCNDCMRHFFYPRSGCPNCGSQSVSWTDVSGRGRLVSFVINHQPLPPAKRGDPEVIAIIELEEGVRMVSNIVDSEMSPDALPLNASVTVDFKPSGEWMLPVFRLAEAV